MNPFESSSPESDQQPRETTETQTVPPTAAPAPAPEIKQDERLTSIPVAAEAEVPAQAFPSELTFSCLLLPRFHDHYLTGDITDYLVEWMRQVCISYGWRLNAIAVRPGYLHWVMTVPLNANPAQFMRIIRRQTSEKIFEDFPRYKQKNVSGEFWAPGNFVVPGDQLQSPESINSFILQTRRHQGIV
ncbi:MAG TPA: transposase [Anaerolineales bacterium]|nr:transposase [Anaerolineales bacterium]